MLNRSNIKRFIPPIVFSLIRSLNYQDNSIYSGNFKTWNDAMENSVGYSAHSILEKCKNSILKIKNNEAVFERDSVLFNEPQYPWPLIACLQHIALENRNTLKVIDFGGSLGSTYFQSKIFLEHLDQLSWTVVEQENFVECGLKNFVDNHLNFEYTITDTLNNTGPVNCMILSGVLQCLEEPFKLIDEVLNTNIKYLLLDRTSFITGEPRLMVLKINDIGQKASYPLWFFNEEELLVAITSKYDLLTEFDSTADGTFKNAENETMYWKGYLFKIKN